MTTHTHRASSTRTEPFRGPVASRQNPAAHGNICQVATCSCGATRRTNFNQSHVERGAWDDSGEDHDA